MGLHNGVNMGCFCLFLINQMSLCNGIKCDVCVRCVINVHIFTTMESKILISCKISQAWKIRELIAYL